MVNALGSCSTWVCWLFVLWDYRLRVHSIMAVSSVDILMRVILLPCSSSCAGPSGVARWAASAKWAAGSTLDAQCATPLGLSLSEWFEWLDRSRLCATYPYSLCTTLRLATFIGPIELRLLHRAWKLQIVFEVAAIGINVLIGCAGIDEYAID